MQSKNPLLNPCIVPKRGALFFKTVKVSITLRRDTLDKIEILADRYDRSKSRVINLLLDEALAGLTDEW